MKGYRKYKVEITRRIPDEEECSGLDEAEEEEYKGRTPLQKAVDEDLERLKDFGKRMRRGF